MIYLDNAATTATDKKVVEAMLPYFSDIYGNPSSLHRLGRKAKAALERSRQVVADFLSCDSREVIFTNGGTESINLAIMGYARKIGKGEIITSQIEHHAVLHSCDQLEKEGFKVTKLPVSSDGLLDLKAFEKALTKDTILVSIMYANNEIGTIQPIKQIAKIIAQFNNKTKANVLFHTDACQATGYLPMNVKNLCVDFLSLNGSKIYGPKGIGALYKREGIEIDPIIFGGGQEMGFRSGTENVAGIVGLAKAIELIDPKEAIKETKLRDYFIKKLLEIDGVVLNGSLKKRLPNNINVSFAAVEGEAVVLRLDKEGIAASTGSACSSKSLTPSHVITALENSPERAHESIRFTIGRKTGKKDIDIALAKTKAIIKSLREISSIESK